MVHHRGHSRDNRIDGVVRFALFPQFHRNPVDIGLVNFGQREAASPKAGEVGSVDASGDGATVATLGITYPECTIITLFSDFDDVRHHQEAPRFLS